MFSCFLINISSFEYPLIYLLSFCLTFYLDVPYTVLNLQPSFLALQCWNSRHVYLSQTHYTCFLNRVFPEKKKKKKQPGQLLALEGNNKPCQISKRNCETRLYWKGKRWWRPRGQCHQPVTQEVSLAFHLPGLFWWSFCLICFLGLGTVARASKIVKAACCPGPQHRFIDLGTEPSVL